MRTLNKYLQTSISKHFKYFFENGHYLRKCKVPEDYFNKISGHVEKIPKDIHDIKELFKWLQEADSDYLMGVRIALAYAELDHALNVKHTLSLAKVSYSVYDGAITTNRSDWRSYVPVVQNNKIVSVIRYARELGYCPLNETKSHPLHYASHSLYSKEGHYNFKLEKMPENVANSTLTEMAQNEVLRRIDTNEQIHLFDNNVNKCATIAFETNEGNILVLVYDHSLKSASLEPLSMASVYGAITGKELLHHVEMSLFKTWLKNAALAYLKGDTSNDYGKCGNIRVN